MSGRRRKGGGAAATHTHLAIKVEEHEVSTEASLHIDLDRNFGRPFGYEDDPAYTFSTRVRIFGVCTYPPERAADSYELTFVGQEPPVGALPRTVGSFQVQDEEGRPKWRRHQGKQYPVYEGPPGITLLSRRRGTQTWEAWLNVPPRFVTDMLLLLPNVRPLFVSLHERKLGRDRWLQSVALQMTDPEKE